MSGFVCQCSPSSINFVPRALAFQVYEIRKPWLAVRNGETLGWGNLMLKRRGAC